MWKKILKETPIHTQTYVHVLSFVISSCGLVRVKFTKIPQGYIIETGVIWSIIAINIIIIIAIFLIINIIHH